MKKLIVVCAMLSCFGGITFAKEGEPAGKTPGVSAGVDYFSNYFWRGYDFYGAGVGVFFPWATCSIGETGLSLNYLGEYGAETLGDGVSHLEKTYQGADFGAAYTRTFSESVTVGAKLWYYGYYKSKDMNERVYGNRHDESFFTGTVSLTIDALPLAPTFTYNHDYYVDDYKGDRENDKDFYAQFQLSHTLKLGSEAGLALKGGIAYYNQATARLESHPGSVEKKGISDITASADLIVTKGGVSFHGGLFYAYVPDKDWYTMTDGSKDRHRWWSGFGASYAL